MHKKLLTLAALLALPMMLAGCETLGQATASSTLTASGRPAACLSLSRISPSRGKPNVTTEEVEAELNRDNPISRVRNVVGDTSSTLTQIDRNNAALAALCGGADAGVPR